MAQVTVTTKITIDGVMGNKDAHSTSYSDTFTEKFDKEAVLSTTAAATLWDPVNDATQVTDFTTCLIETNATTGVDIEFAANATGAAATFDTKRIYDNLPFLLSSSTMYQQDTTDSALGAATDAVQCTRIRAANPTTSTSVTVRLILVS